MPYGSPSEMSPYQNQNKGYAKQERKDLLQDNPVAKDASGGRSWMSKHSKSVMGSAMKMKHGSPAKAVKPDFPDIDGDGDRKESMKKAAKDKKKKKKETKEATGASSSGSFNAPLDFHEGKKSLQLSEEDMIDLIEKIIEEQKIEGITSQNKALKQSKKDTES